MNRLLRHPVLLLMAVATIMTIVVVAIGVTIKFSSKETNNTSIGSSGTTNQAQAYVSVPPEALPLPKSTSNAFQLCAELVPHFNLESIQSAVQVYSAFPSKRGTEILLKELKPLVSKAFYDRTTLTWKASKSPLKWAQQAAVTQCTVGSRLGLVQELKMDVHVNTLDQYGPARPVDLEYSVYIYQLNSGFRVLGIYPPDTIDLRQVTP